MIERWLPVVGWEGLYEVSDHGRVRSRDRTIQQTDARGNLYPRQMLGRILRNKVCTKGPYGNWLSVCLGNGADGRSYRLVSRLVLEAFAGACPEGMEAAHNDGNPEDNQLSNLRWDTHSNNQRDITRHGHDYNMRRRLSDEEVREIRAAVAAGESHVSLAQRYNFTINAKRCVQGISSIINGRTYTRVPA